MSLLRASRATPCLRGMVSARYYHPGLRLSAPSPTTPAAGAQLPDAPPSTTGHGSQAAWTTSRPHENWVMPHMRYTPEEAAAVKVVHHPRLTLGDKGASFAVAFARKMFDWVTRYKHADPEAGIRAAREAGKGDLSLQQLRDGGYVMTPDQWMMRFIFLETIAGVPGMCAGMLRHLRSMRSLRRDGGWIHTLLEEAENERMHLLTFLKMSQPGWFFRLVIIGAQGVFMNAFFVTYLVNPKVCHRFVGCLEEEAVHTYTGVLAEIEAGRLPEWSKEQMGPLPRIATDYWGLKESDGMWELISQIRADEAGHRFVNHTFANLNQREDMNPVAFKHADATTQGQLPGFTREQSLEWSKSVKEEYAKEIKKEEVAAEKEAKDKK